MDTVKANDLARNAAESMHASSAWAEAEAQRIALEMVGSGRKVLSLGHLDEGFARALRERGCQVVAVLSDPKAITRLRPRVSAVIQGDVERVHLAQFLRGRTFDVVLVGRLLQRVADPVAVLRKAAPHVARGGYIVASLPNVAHASVRLGLLRGAFEVGVTQESLRLFTKQTIERTFHSAGFRMARVERARIDPYARPFLPSGVAWDKASVPPALRRLIEGDPEAAVAQYVIKGEPSDEIGAALSDEEELASRMLFSAEQRALLEGPAREAEAERVAAMERAEALEAALAAARAEAETARQSLDDLLAEKRAVDEALANLPRSIRERIEGLGVVDQDCASLDLVR